MLASCAVEQSDGFGMDSRHYWEENGPAVKYENFNSNDGFNRQGDPTLNFATGALASEDDGDYLGSSYLKKGKVSRQQDPMSHRVIEKRRRDRMNNCLADLSRLIPPEYLKKGRGRVEKTEIIEMAIRRLKYLQDRAHGADESRERSEGPISLENYRLGYQECRAEVMRYLVETQGYLPTDSLCVQLVGHLHRHCDSITKGTQPAEPPALEPRDDQLVERQLRHLRGEVVRDHRARAVRRRLQAAVRVVLVAGHARRRLPARGAAADLAARRPQARARRRRRRALQVQEQHQAALLAGRGARHEREAAAEARLEERQLQLEPRRGRVRGRVAGGGGRAARRPPAPHAGAAAAAHAQSGVSRRAAGQRAGESLRAGVRAQRCRQVLRAAQRQLRLPLRLPRTLRPAAQRQHHHRAAPPRQHQRQLPTLPRIPQTQGGGRRTDVESRVNAPCA